MRIRRHSCAVQKLIGYAKGAQAAPVAGSMPGHMSVLLCEANNVLLMLGDAKESVSQLQSFL